MSAGNGLGSGSNPEKWLDKEPNVTPLRATGLKLLIGKSVCAVVYKSDVSMNYGPLNGSLKGDNLGTVAFKVISVTPARPASPRRAAEGLVEARTPEGLPHDQPARFLRCSAGSVLELVTDGLAAITTTRRA